MKSLSKRLVTDRGIGEDSVHLLFGRVLLATGSVGGRVSWGGSGGRAPRYAPKTTAVPSLLDYNVPSFHIHW